MARVAQVSAKVSSFNRKGFGYQSGYFSEGKAEKLRNQLINMDIYKLNGGERGIRTLEGFYTLHAFQACAIDHSATSPIFSCHLAFRWRQPTQPHLGARIHCYRCSLPGLAEFTIYRREGTKVGHHSGAYASRIN